MSLWQKVKDVFFGLAVFALFLWSIIWLGEQVEGLFR